jgi:hypothetical protein
MANTFTLQAQELMAMVKARGGTKRKVRGC